MHTLLIADGFSFGRRKVIIEGIPHPESIAAHLQVAFSDAADSQFGSGFVVDVTDRCEPDGMGLYIGHMYRHRPDDREYRFAEHIKVRQPKLWERFI